MRRQAPIALRRRVARSALAAWLALACAAGDATPQEAALSPCSDPRPQMCTKEYRPVCGHRCAAPPCDPAERRSHGNACDACAHSEVRAFTPGTCEEGPQAEPPRLR